MIRSMTGFASIERQYAFGRLVWEMRSVNHRYLDFNFRLPEEFRVLEPRIRNTISGYLSRGKIDATLRFHPSGNAASDAVKLNVELADALLGLHQDYAARAGLKQDPNINKLLRWPGVVIEESPDPEPLHQAAMALLDEAVQQLQAGREREGAVMAQAIIERLDGITTWIGDVRQWLPEIRDALRAKMLERVDDLQQPLEPGRLEQELAFLAQKADVAEELDRIDAHVLETRRALDLEEPVGRRLDFLMQEFNRESNTLSSKSVDQRTSKAAVELKVLIEQIREQVQNIE
ncbi:MAG: YicC family protein [Xanthomonadales bacterium]|nr:YicC family protein [Gammaproteobacteria bacterium]NNE06008.1 YicC family protein [Xanthomonadales bacterium]NNL94711.1 YicC family protein [Xanthomonadales bacterium]